MMQQVSTRRLSLWLLPVLLALVLLVFWLARPEFDYRLPTDPADPLGNPFHFWIISAASLIALAMGGLMSAAAQRRSDARVFLVSLAVLNAAAAIMLHALATTNILVQGRNIGFVVAAPLGLVLAAIFAVASTTELSPRQAAAVVERWQWLRLGTLIFWAAFGVIALLRLPPLTLIPTPETVDTPLFFCLLGQAPLPAFQFPATAALVVAAGMYGWTGATYLGRFRKRPTAVLFGLAVAFCVLAITTLNVGLARTWRLTWWQWHVLVLVAFGLLAYSAYRQFRSEGDAQVIYDSVYLEETIKKIRQEYSTALEALVAALRRRAESDDATETGPVAVQVAQRFGLSDGQVRVLEQAAEALAHEREQLVRLGALVAVGQETRVILEESQLLQRSMALAGEAFKRDRLQIGLVQEGRLEFPAELSAGAIASPSPGYLRQSLLSAALKEGQPVEDQDTLVLPLTVKGRVAGVLEVQRTRGAFADRDRWLLRSLASQLSVALENARLYRQIDALFRQYMPASVATALIADPSQAALGGAVRTISVMFGDLRGFTSLSERLSPPDLVRILNRYYGAAAREVLEQGGTIDKFMGDAMMALFNAPSHQPDHALRACRAALAMQRVIAPIAAEAGDMPRFGIGINTGDALVGNIGSEAIRNFTAIGDTVNLAARLQTRALGGQVLISGSTYAQVQDSARVEPLGQIQVKGKEELVEAYLLLEMRD